MNQVATNAIAAIGTAMRNTVWIDSAYPATKPSRTAADRWLSTAGVTSALLKPFGSVTPCRWLARLPISTLEKIAPKIAVPKEPPIDRKNVAAEVATPSSLCGTAFCTIVTSTCMTPPMPAPRTSM